MVFIIIPCFFEARLAFISVMTNNSRLMIGNLVGI